MMATVVLHRLPTFRAVDHDIEYRSGESIAHTLAVLENMTHVSPSYRPVVLPDAMSASLRFAVLSMLQISAR